MIGLLFFAGLLMYFLLWVPTALVLHMFAQTYNKKRIVTWVSLAVWILIPFGDHMAGMSYHLYLCDTQDAGFNQYKNVKVKAKGLLNRSSSASGAYSYLKQGYDYIEARTSDALPNDRASLSRYTLSPDGKLREERIDKARAKFEIIKNFHIRLKLNIYKHSILLVERRSERVIASYDKYAYLGGWLFNYFIPYYIKRCSEDEANYYGLFDQVLGHE